MLWGRIAPALSVAPVPSLALVCGQRLPQFAGDVTPSCAVVQRLKAAAFQLNQTRVRNGRRREATFVELDTSQHKDVPRPAR